MLEAHAKALAANRSKRMVLEGHTDERGGREYNLALGQKRAEAVLKSLVLLGVPDSQLEAVSFGKERPAGPGSDEAAWAKNRRVELKDRVTCAPPCVPRPQSAAASPLALRCAAALAGAGGAGRSCSTTTRRARPSSTCARALAQSDEQVARAPPS